jgi:hemerythrin-like domain-containing protein
LTLIETLQVQHAEIARRVQCVNDALNRGSMSDICVELDGLRAVLRTHLAMEDARLYPALTRAAEQTQLEVPAKVARTYEHNMQTISVAVEAFLERYGHAFSLDDFRRDWALVSQLLADRIESEEATLYPLYNSWVRDSST